MVRSVQPVQPVHSSVAPGGISPLSRGELKPAVKRIVLAGNPNVGKSAIFNALTGLNADVSNYPGTTIDVSRGKVGDREIIDTPGIYGVSSFNDEERIARQIIVDTELIINVVSALSLDRDLFLTLQLIAMGKPLLLVINQWDEALARGIKINTTVLSELLGVPVLTTVAVTGTGINDISRRLSEVRVGVIDAQLSALLNVYTANGARQDLVLLALEGDDSSSAILAVQCPNNQADIYRARRRQVNQIFEN